MNEEQIDKISEIAEFSNSIAGSVVTGWKNIKCILLALEAKELGIKAKDMV